MELQELLDVCQILYDANTSMMVTLTLPKHLTCTRVGKVLFTTISSIFLIAIDLKLTSSHLTQAVLHFKWQPRTFPTGPSALPKAPALSTPQLQPPATPAPTTHQKKPSIHFTQTPLQAQIPPTPSPNPNIPRTPAVPTTPHHAPLTLKIKPPAPLPPQTPTPTSATAATPKSGKKKKDKDKDRLKHDGRPGTPGREEGGGGKLKKIKTDPGPTPAGNGVGGGGANTLAPPTPTPQKMVVPLKIKLKLNPKGVGGGGGGGSAGG